MWKILILSFLLSVVLSKPVEKQESDESFGFENPDLIEGDIVPDDDNDRNAVVDKKKIWTNGVIPYVISAQLSGQTEAIRVAMNHIEKKTCIRFVKRTTEKNYVNIYRGGGCSSKIGMIGKVQNLSLGTGCYKTGKIIHELGHALGFYHEQNRSDRDKYIVIHWENIQKGSEDQFEKREPFKNRLITPYDYESVMHYDGLTFSKDKEGNLLTMTPKKHGAVLRKVSEKELSPDDIKRIRVLYKCP